MCVLCVFLWLSDVCCIVVLLCCVVVCSFISLNVFVCVLDDVVRVVVVL